MLHIANCKYLSLILSLLMLSCPGLLGCTSSEQEKAVEQETSNLRPLSIVLGQYRSRHRGQMPADEEAFREYLQSPDGQRLLERFEFSNPDELLISNRDNKPFVILYEAPSAGGVIAYEQEGTDGTRMVVDTLGVVQSVSDEEFRKLVPEAQ